ncbi:MAG: methyl-accepting chemotaxis protein [Oscillospiraceae bacterium]|nr:methyl-accepting chemotaxis protein [Oscillospiraceae bacterium]
MKKLFAFKKMSAKISFVVAAAVVLVGGSACAYMQTRIIEEIDNNARLYVRYRLREESNTIDNAILEGLGDSQIQAIVDGVQLYQTGGAIMADSAGRLIGAGALAQMLTAGEQATLFSLARESQNQAFDIRLGGANFTSAQAGLVNGYSLFIFAPRNEVMADVYASLTRFAVIFIVVVAIVVLVSRKIGKSMAAPLIPLNAFIARAGNIGDISLSEEERAEILHYAQSEDEIGQVMGATAILVDHLLEVTEKLEEVAGGNLAVAVKPLGEKDVMGTSLKEMVDHLSEMFADINDASGRVSEGSSQIADGAQTLAQGSTEQAATIQQLSASAVEISEKTKNNAQMAGRAAELAFIIKGNAEKGSRQMDEMVGAVGEISQASQSIGKVIKVIDDIAFQTNILALNAAVEAARAGQHGKGFAVVADEVRALAAKSAEAAKDTGALISNSMEKAEQGALIAKDTAESLAEIVLGIGESNVIIEEIADVSQSQTTSVAQINAGIEQVAIVVQQNSAAAEQSAATAQELREQAAMLAHLIDKFKLKV